jgi:hypothetical protein
LGPRVGQFEAITCRKSSGPLRLGEDFYPVFHPKNGSQHPEIGLLRGKHPYVTPFSCKPPLWRCGIFDLSGFSVAERGFREATEKSAFMRSVQDCEHMFIWAVCGGFPPYGKGSEGMTTPGVISSVSE